MKMRFKVLLAAGAAMAFSSNAFASVANDASTANSLVTTQTSTASATTTSTIIAGSVAAAIAPPPIVIAPPPVAAPAPVPVVAPAPSGAPAPAPAGAPAPSGGSSAPSGGSGGSGGQGGPNGGNGGNNDQSFFNTRAMSGVAAGGSMPKMGAWVQGGYTTIDVSDVGGEFNGDVTNLVGGIDFKPRSNMVLGLAVSYEDVDITTKFNNGQITDTGFTFVPYFGMNLKNGISLSASVGYGMINYDTKSNNGATTGSYDAERWMFNGSVSKAFQAKNMTITPKFGILETVENSDAYVTNTGTAVAATTNKLGRASLGGTVSFNLAKVSPYISAMAEYDYRKGDAADLGNGNFSSNDKFGVNAAVGLNAAVNNKVSLNIEASSASNFRNNLDTYGISGRLRVDF